MSTEPNQVELPLLENNLYALVDARAMTPENLTFFFDKDNPWALAQSSKLLEYLIFKNQYDTFNYLLTPENGYHFKKSSKLFDSAAGAKNPQFLKYLLDNHTPSSPKPELGALITAIRSSNFENAQLLLNPVFELKPDRAIPQEAITHKMTDLVKLLMKKERQFGLNFRQEDLKNACEPYYGPLNFVPDINLITFMLKPRFGLTLTQEFFDGLFSRASDKRANCRYTNLEVVLYLLDNYKILLTQETFERWFNEGEFLPIVNLLHLDFKRFSYLKVTLDMLATTIRLRSGNYAKYLLHPFFGLIVNNTILDLAVEHHQYEIMTLLLNEHNLIPSEEELITLLRHGKAEECHQWLSQYKIAITDTLLSSLPEISTLECFEIALDLVKENNLLGFDKPIESGVSYSCLERYELMLDPKYHIRCELVNLEENQRSYTAYVFRNLPSIEKLVKSDASIKMAIQALKEQGDGQVAFQEALELSPCQCLRVASYALSHPEEYDLDDLAQKGLLTLMAKSLHDACHFSVVDLLVIRSYLIQAQKRLLAKEAYLLANELPIDAIDNYLNPILCKEPSLPISGIRS